jgi:hypothetical protein
MLGAWCTLLQLAAKMPRRGDLVKDGKPLDSEDIAIATGMPKSLIEEMVANCSSDKIKWIELVVCEKYAPIPLHSEDAPREDREHPEDAPATGQDKTGQNKEERERTPAGGLQEGTPPPLAGKAARAVLDLMPAASELKPLAESILSARDDFAFKRPEAVVQELQKSGLELPLLRKVVESYVADFANMETAGKNPLGMLRSYLSRGPEREGQAGGTSNGKRYPTTRWGSDTGEPSGPPKPYPSIR